MTYDKKPDPENSLRVRRDGSGRATRRCRELNVGWRTRRPRRLCRCERSFCSVSFAVLSFRGVVFASRRVAEASRRDSPFSIGPGESKTPAETQHKPPAVEHSYVL